MALFLLFLDKRNNVALLFYYYQVIKFMNLNDLVKKVKLSGGKITKTRQAILEGFISNNKPISSADILDILKKNKIIVNRTTVYRELLFLLSNGFIREVKLIGCPSLFELIGDHQHHLICVKCNDIKTVIMDNHLDDEEQNIMKQEKFKITNHCLEFYGLCQKCQKSN